MASLYLTVPVVTDTPQTQLIPTPDDMGLESINPNLLYGFHGGNATKGPALRSVYLRADADGLIASGKRFYYLVDLVCKTSEKFDDSLLLGQLQSETMSKVPHLITKRVARRCAEDLGDLWRGWAKEMYGERTVSRADVDWGEVTSFIPVFPNAAERLFDQFSHLRCAVIPINMVNEKGQKKLTWVGVMPKEKAVRWVDSAEVRMQPQIKPNLKFK